MIGRLPHLRVISMEQGCPHGCIPSTGIFKRLRTFDEAPSVTAKWHIKVAPFAGEPVGWALTERVSAPRLS